MKRKLFLAGGIIFILTAFLLAGCSLDKEPLEAEEPKENNEEQVIEEEPEEPEEKLVQSRLTGLWVKEEDINPRVIAVMLDNQRDARPQAGLSQSDIVYEILAEGNITRYMAIFESRRPEEIGPVRSARDYFIERALEYDAFYVHVGGSPSGLAAISRLHVASINGMNQGADVLWREKHKKAPHNVYASYASLIKGASNKDYREEGEYQGLLFLEKPESIGEEEATSLDFPYRKENYYVSYAYDSDEKVYYRSVNGQLHKDEYDGEALHTTNILIQFVKTRAVPGDTEGRLEMDMIGQGQGYYVSMGNMIPTIWKKKDEKSMTRYYHEDGEEIKLNPGNIWIQVYPDSRKSEVLIQ